MGFLALPTLLNLIRTANYLIILSRTAQSRLTAWVPALHDDTRCLLRLQESAASRHFYILSPGKPKGPALPLENCFSIFCISRNCLSSRFTSFTWVPLPRAMRWRRLPSMRSG